jgi:molybdopterin biosynthesis enzyme
MMSLLTAADCLVVRPVGAPATARGEIVRILRLSGGALGI